MSQSRKPALPAAVEARMKNRIFATSQIRMGEAALDRFLKAVRVGDAPDRKDLRIVAVQLEQVLGGMSFDRAFGLQKGQGRKPSRDISLRNQVICAEVEELRKEGSKLEDAAELVAQRYEVSAESVSRLHKTRNKEYREVLALLKRDK